MPTSLFPEHPEPVKINQGKVKDCYLLAALDCLFHLQGNKGLEHVRQLFQNSETGIILRITSPEIQSYLKIAKLQEDGYRCIEGQIFMTHAQVDNIASDDRGVETNAPAVKIIEQMMPYYFPYPWEKECDNTLEAYRYLKRHGDMKSAEFVAAFIGVDGRMILSLNKLSKLNLFLPDFPIYVSFQYRENSTVRHALRLEQLCKQSNVFHEPEVIFINPWNNQVKEPCSYATLQSKKQKRFCIFSIEPEHRYLIELVLRTKKSVCEKIFKEPDVLTMLVRCGQYFNSLKNYHDFISKAFQLLHQSRSLAVLFKSLSLESEQQCFAECVSYSQGDLKLFVDVFLRHTNRLDLLKEAKLLEVENNPLIANLGLFQNSIPTVGAQQNLAFKPAFR